MFLGDIMPKAIFLASNGESVVLEVKAGENLMRAATQAGVTGIIGDCGGNLACSTCHVYVDENFLRLLDLPSDHEDDMLEYTAAPRTPTSRLCCQIIMSDTLSGIRVEVAHPQV